MSHSSSVDSLAIDSSAAPTAIVPDYRLDMVGEPCPYQQSPHSKRCHN